MLRLSPNRWWRDRFVTLMVVPERTRRVHKLVVPFFLLKMGGVLFSLIVVFLVVIGVDYVHVLARLGENKRLKGENFKLRQEIQIIRNKVDSMESTVERVRNYAKKLQMLTGQGDKVIPELPQGPIDTDIERSPSGGRSGSAIPMVPSEPGPTGYIGTPGGKSPPLHDRVERLQTVALGTEVVLSSLQSYLFAQSAVMAATPSLLPITGWVSSPFGYRRHPYDGSYRLHSGVDIAADPGTPVRAPADGLVIYSGYREGYGKVVVIDHGYGIRTLFAHLSTTFVNAGIRVRRGEILSQVGSTGQSTGPHLHYEIRKNGVPVNPVTFFSRVRF